MRLDRVLVNLERRQARQVLLGTVASLERGLSPHDVEELCADLEGLAPDEDVRIEPTVRFQNEDLPFVVDAFKKEADRCELVFIVPRVLGDLVRAQLHAICPNARPQVLSGGGEEEA